MNFQGMYEDHDQQQHAPGTGTATADIDLTGTANDSNPLQIQSSISASSSASTSTSNSVSNLKSNGLRNPSAEVQGVERMSNISGSGMANNSKSESVKAGQQDQVDVNVNVNVDANGNAKIEGERTESETAMEERLVAENCRQITQDATDKLHSALQRIKNVTKSMLSEMEVYLESAQSVEIEYVRCQHSQRKEGMRLMDVEPDITGTTSSLKFGMS